MSGFLSRRNFIRLSGAATGTLVLPNAVAASVNSSKNVRSEMIYRTLGRTGLKLPIVNLGVMRVDNPRIVTASLNEGIIHLDTAHGYQNGRNEEMLGELLKDRPRNSFIISTKINPRGKVLSVAEFNEMFELSLKRLQMSYVDILYLHSVNDKETLMHENYLKAIGDLKKQGKVRFTGVSTHANMPQVIEAAVDSKFYDIVLTTYNFKMNNIAEMNAAIEKAAKAGLGIIGMKSMAGGFWDKEKQKPINSKAALKWVLQNENVHTTIPGCTTFDELDTNMEVLRDITMTNEEINDLKDDGQHTGMFCSGCGECLWQCRNGLPVPDLMRAYMYAYGYRDLALAREVVDERKIAGNPCENCDGCTVNCPSGFNIAQKTADILRIREIPADFLA